MIYTAPEKFNKNKLKSTIFLAGTIDLGNSEDWQAKEAEFFNNKGFDVFNPRRKNWPEENSKEFDIQVNWELDCLDICDYVIMNILPDSKSPISLLELGLYINKVYVICSDKFYRYGNVRIVCERHGIELNSDMDDFKKNSVFMKCVEEGVM